CVFKPYSATHGRLRRMFLPFFDNLRGAGLPVSLREYLTFLEAMGRGLVTYDIEGRQKHAPQTPMRCRIRFKNTASNVKIRK
ncbi:MAG: hypothetical protein AAFY09_09840, partial [Pseudomonadota bacterium]